MSNEKPLFSDEEIFNRVVESVLEKQYGKIHSEKGKETLIRIIKEKQGFAIKQAISEARKQFKTKIDKLEEKIKNMEQEIAGDNAFIAQHQNCDKS